MGMTKVVLYSLILGCTLVIAKEQMAFPVECKDSTKLEFEYNSTLDTKDAGQYLDWKIEVASENDWFRYFNNISEIPGDVEYNAISYTVGFPLGFNKKDFLTDNEDGGVWMTVHSYYPPNLDKPVAHIDFSAQDKTKYYDTIIIEYYLNGNSSLEFNISNQTVVFNNTAEGPKAWAYFSLCEIMPSFRSFTLNIYTWDNSSFAMIKRIFVGRKAPIYRTTPTTESKSRFPLIETSGENTADIVTYTLDVEEDSVRYNWRFSPGWFQYFNFTDYIAKDVEYNDIRYTVGFPPGFTGEESLKNTEGIWMMRHDNYSPDFDYPIAQINFSTVGDINREFDVVDITCYLNADAILKFIHPDCPDPLIFEHPSDSDVEWYTFSVDKGSFNQFRLELVTPYDSLEAFAMIDKITLTSGWETSTTERRTTTTTTTERETSITTENEITTENGTTTTENETTEKETTTTEKQTTTEEGTSTTENKTTVKETTTTERQTTTENETTTENQTTTTETETTPTENETTTTEQETTTENETTTTEKVTTTENETTATTEKEITTTENETTATTEKETTTTENETTATTEKETTTTEKETTTTEKETTTTEKETTTTEKETSTEKATTTSEFETTTENESFTTTTGGNDDSTTAAATGTENAESTTDGSTGSTTTDECAPYPTETVEPTDETTRTQQPSSINTEITTIITSFEPSTPSTTNATGTSTTESNSAGHLMDDVKFIWLTFGFIAFLY